MLNRRSLLGGLGVTLAAPAIIRTPGLLMPVRRVLVPEITIARFEISEDGGFSWKPVPARRGPGDSYLIDAPLTVGTYRFRYAGLPIA